MTEPKKRTEHYKGYELLATATPLGALGGFTAGLWICREEGSQRTETKVDSGPNVKAWIHDTADKAIHHALLVGVKWVDDRE